MYDVAVIGAGVVGSSIARELSRFQLDVVVLDKGSDVATGSSKANSGIVHAGYDAKPGTLKAKYNVAGNPMFAELSAELDFPYKPIGNLVVAFSREEVGDLEELLTRGQQNGVPDLQIIDSYRLHEIEPNLRPEALAALDVPTGGIVCPYEMTIAFAENAAANGVTFLLEHQVDQVTRDGKLFRISTCRGDVEAGILINAAGLHSDTINNMLSAEKLEIIPRRGEYFLLDHTEGGLVNRTIFQVPGKMGKGILVTPSVDGNILLGPTSVDIGDKDDVETTREGMQHVYEGALRDVASIPMGKVIASFSGLRAHSTSNDFVIGPRPDVPGFINVAGIESPGLTSAPAIAKDVAAMVAEMARPHANPKFNPVRKATPRFRHMTNEERREAIARDRNYGHMICRCENVTKAEIVGALNSPLGIRDLDAIKRRTRAGMGRCQGGFCSMRLPEIIAEAAGIPMTEVTKFGGNSRLLFYKNKTTL